RRIDRLAARVVGDLEPAAVDAGHPVDDPLAEVDPDREMPGLETVRRRLEVVDLLPRRADGVADDVGEELAEPRTAGEDVDVGLDARAVLEARRRHRAVRDLS